MLTSTLRKPEVWGSLCCKVSLVVFIGKEKYYFFHVKFSDNWTLKEIALFEAAMCNFGKDFHAVQRAVRLFCLCFFI
jgi:hypothetical protein